ncbi:hypothetical protein [Eisenbergiella tayi]|uniref:hypothetical protein n=1 Tax=Eisenbergiella tayi TaxID=1432052 RepID=UPI0014958B0E|nr:hypothetical protein [Eisenbergiella tayi]
MENDIAPLFRKLISEFPMEALDELERGLLPAQNDRAVALMLDDIRAERSMKEGAAL